jgi:hypothetical protein
VKLPLAPTLRQQIDRFSFRFTCDDCAHFARRDDDDGVCAHGYPTEEHRATFSPVGDREARPPVGDREARQWVVFCKEFELS